MNECNEGIHNIVRYAYTQFEIKFGNCDNCHSTIALKDGYNQVGQSEIYKRHNTDKGMALDRLLGKLREQESFNGLSEDEKQYIQILNSTLKEDPLLFRLYLRKYESVRKIDKSRKV